MRKGKGRRWFLQWTFIVLILPEISNCHKQKRQIFREQVLPALGGKIPEEAFRTDRLALNRLNKEGITVGDGVLLEARHHDKHPNHGRIQPEVIKARNTRQLSWTPLLNLSSGIRRLSSGNRMWPAQAKETIAELEVNYQKLEVYATVDNRYIPPEGRYHYNHPKTVDTTYVIRKPIADSSHTLDPPMHRPILSHLPARAQSYVNFHPQTAVPHLPLSVPTPPKIYKPVIKPLILPASHILFSGFYHPSWDHPDAFDWSGSRFSNQHHEEHLAVVDAFQNEENYEGFLNNFHGRILRHTENPARANAVAATGKSPPFDVSLSSLENSKREMTIPETGFSCEGRTGTFADIKTNCQVFHECSGWRKTSSACPLGTAYSEALKRCEWEHQVKCSA